MGKLLEGQIYQQEDIDRINKETGKEYERQERIKHYQRHRYEMDKWEKQSLYYVAFLVSAGLLAFFGAMIF